MVSIVIPAFNEEAVIGRTLDALLKHPRESDLQILVCCNGCTDRTAQIARQYGPPVQVLETSRGSKPLALNMGDAAAVSFPRIYLDADIVLSDGAVSRIAEALENSDGLLAAAPRMCVDLRDRPWTVRAFYNVWLQTPYHKTGMIGSGVYALSEKGRRRFAEFPSIIADDAFVRAHFAPEERQILEDCTFTLTPPVNLRALLKIKTRAVLGNMEISAKFPELLKTLEDSEMRSEGKHGYRAIVSDIAHWPQLCVYALVRLFAKFRARAQMRSLAQYRWERDETTRTKSAFS